MLTRVNPEGLHDNPAFSQMVIIPPSATLIVIGGQNAVNAAGEITGHDLASQTEQAIKNVITALAAVGATLRDVVKMTITIVQGQRLEEGYTVVGRFPELRTHPPAIRVMVVAGLAHPDFLIEIDAIAAIQTGEIA